MASSVYNNSISETRSYNNDNTLASINFTGASIGNLTYGWDNNKNKTSETITGTMSGYGFTTGTTGYDTEDRLVTWNRADNNLTKSWNLSLVGDWTSVTENATTQSRTHGPTHELLTAAGQNVTTDTKGNITLLPAALRPSTNPLSLTWDQDNRLSSADVNNDNTADVTYQWDALGRRVARDDGTNVTIFVQSGQQTIADYPSGAAPSSPTYTYYYASYIDEPVMRAGVGPLRYYHRNQQYSITALTDSSGNITERYAYTAYGTPTITDGAGATRTTSADNNRYMYTGREWDETLSLYHYRARMYDSISGRFLSRDPIGYVDGQNCFVAYFVHSSRVDPSGFSCKDTCNDKYYRDGGFPIFRDLPPAKRSEWYERCVSKCGPTPPPSLCSRLSKSCPGCTQAGCEADMKRIRDIIDGTEVEPYDWEYIKEHWTKDECDRWVMKASSQLPRFVNPFNCIASADQIRWSYYLVAGHVAIKFTMCDGTVIYVDNGWEGGDDGIFFPEDVDGFPYTNPQTTPIFD